MFNKEAISSSMLIILLTTFSSVKVEINSGFNISNVSYKIVTMLSGYFSLKAAFVSLTRSV